MNVFVMYTCITRARSHVYTSHVQGVRTWLYSPLSSSKDATTLSYSEKADLRPTTVALPLYSFSRTVPLQNSCVLSTSACEWRAAVEGRGLAVYWGRRRAVRGAYKGDAGWAYREMHAICEQRPLLRTGGAGTGAN